MREQVSGGLFLVHTHIGPFGPDLSHNFATWICGSQWIFSTFLFRLKTSSVQCMWRKTDDLQEPTDILSSKLTFSVKSFLLWISFDAKISVGSCKSSVLRHMHWTLNVFKRNKNCSKTPLCGFECVNFLLDGSVCTQPSLTLRTSL